MSITLFRIAVFLSLAMPLLYAVPQEAHVLRGRVVDASERPVAGARVSYGRYTRRTRMFRRIESVLSSPRGTFQIEVPGTANRRGRVIQVESEGRATFARRLEPGEAEGLVVTLEPGRAVLGKVEDAVTGRPVADAEVTLAGLEARTDSGGMFRFEGVPAAARMLEVRVDARGYVPSQRQVMMGRGDEAMLLTVKRGWVAAAQVVNGEGRPVSGAAVEARLPTAVAYSAIERARYVETTGQDGRVMLRGLPPGLPVCLEATRDGLVPGQSRVLMPRPATEEEAAARAPIRIRVARPGASRSSLRVLDPAGRPIVGARVALRPLVEPRLAFGGPPRIDADRGSYREGFTGEDGRVSFADLSPGAFTVEFSAPGFLTHMNIWRPDAGNPTWTEPMKPDPSPPGTRVPWSPDLDAAWRRAEQEQLPVMVSMTMDGEAANEHMAANHWREPEVVRVARELPVLLATVFQHEEKDGICTKYGTISCAQHQAIEPWAVDQLIDRADFQVPRQIFVTTEGRVLMHREYYLSERDLVRMMMRALRIVNPERAFALGRDRLCHIPALIRTSEKTREQLVALINSGDEHATALLLGLEKLGVPAAGRLQIARGIIPRAILLGGSAWRRLIADPDPAVRLTTVAALSQLPRDADARELLRSRIWDPHPEVRPAVHAALGIAVKNGQWMVEDLATGDRWRTALELLRVVAPEKLSGLDELAASRRQEARNRTLLALAHDRGDAVAERLLLREAFESQGDRRVPALVALAHRAPHLGDPAEAFRRLDALLRSEAPGHVRGAAVDALAGLGLDAVMPRLRGLASDSSVEVAIRSDLALWDHGEREALPRLAARADDQLLGFRIRAVLAEEWRKARPQTAEEWSGWLERRRRGLR